jgi:nucleoside-diphosphate kinase
MAIERTLVNIYLPALERSITGTIISILRFMSESQTKLDIIGADVYNFTDDFVEEFCKTLVDKKPREERQIQEKFKEFLLSEESFNRKKYKMRRVFNIVLEGEDAVTRVSNLMGDIRIRNGITIFGRYGFYKKDENEKIVAAEFPASAPANKEEAEAQLDLMWNKYKSYGGPLEDSIVYTPGKMQFIERSVLIVKPNAFEKPNDPRMGNVIDAISRTGMFIIGAKVQIPAREQMMEFYAAHKGKPFFESLVDFMSAKRSLALLYEGIHARREIRDAALTVVREAYSDSKLENTVHTSENETDFEREFAAVNFKENQLPKLAASEA